MRAAPLGFRVPGFAVPEFDVPVREVRLAAGAGFALAICGDVRLPPGLPHVPAAATIRPNAGRLNAGGAIEGLLRSPRAVGRVVSEGPAR